MGAFLKLGSKNAEFDGANRTQQKDKGRVALRAFFNNAKIWRLGETEETPLLGQENLNVVCSWRGTRRCLLEIIFVLFLVCRFRLSTEAPYKPDVRNNGT